MAKKSEIVMETHSKFEVNSIIGARSAAVRVDICVHLVYADMFL